MTPRQKRPNFADCSIKTKIFLWELWGSYTIDDPGGIKGYMRGERPSTEAILLIGIFFNLKKALIPFQM